jgi:hypothetical protein
MRRIEKRVCIASLIFVAIYLGAIIMTLNSRTENPSTEPKLESAELDAATRHVVLAEVLPPMLVLLTLTICFVLVRKKQQLARLRMEALEEKDISEIDPDPDSSI